MAFFMIEWVGRESFSINVREETPIVGDVVVKWASAFLL
jgi:hypothetical protein